jgi:predicted DNA-binding protein with PD1-like motif
MALRVSPGNRRDKERLRQLKLRKGKEQQENIETILEEQRLQTALAQDNANVSTTRLNTMLLYTQNMLAHLEIISAAQVKR